MNQAPKPNYHVCIEDKKICRPEEIAYCEQIFREYIKKSGQQHLIKRMFQTLHSDWLNLEESILTHNSHSIPVIKSKNLFNEGDILLVIRGSVIGKIKLDSLISQNLAVKNMLLNVNCFLWGKQNIDVLVPKGLGRILLNKDASYMNFLQTNQENKNCFIEYVFDSKYMISASKPIKLGETLVLDIQSLNKFQYCHQLI